MIPGAFKGLDCPVCGDTIHIEDFRDDAALIKHSISGMCQKCQDATKNQILFVTV